MSTIHGAIRDLVGVALLLLGAAPPALAQAPPVRADAFGALGWQAVNVGRPGPSSGDRWDSSLFGNAGAGVYWTDHLKTEVEFGAGTEIRAYHSEQLVVEGRPTFRSTESSFTRRTLAISQHYQYFRNVWFHPYVGGGADLTWQRRTDLVSPVVLFDDSFRSGRTVLPGRLEGPRTEVTVRPFVVAGFKAYMTRRAFFRSDLRAGFGTGMDHTLLRAGFGVDF